MAERKSFLMRVDRDLLDAVQRWANDDLRSLNGQIEFLLRRALREAGRTPTRKRGHHTAHQAHESEMNHTDNDTTNDSTDGNNEN